MKISATTLGETAGDLLSMTMNVGYAKSSLILFSAFLLSLGAQLLSRRYHPLLYWTVIFTTSAAGTTMSDSMDRTLGHGARGLRRGQLGPRLRGRRAPDRGLARARRGRDVLHPHSRALLFWIAFVLTRPFGATVGDVLTKSKEKGDLALGTLGTLGASAILGAVLVGLVIRAMMLDTRARRAT